MKATSTIGLNMNPMNDGENQKGSSASVRHDQPHKAEQWLVMNKWCDVLVENLSAEQI